MSGLVVGWAMKQTTGLPAAKLVLAKLADNAGDEGLAWPSVQLIADHTELGQSTVYRHLATLQALGLIEPTNVTVHPGTENEYSCEGWQLSVPAEWRIPRVGKRGRVARKAIPAAGKPYKEEPSTEPSLNLAPSVAPPVTGRVERLSHQIGQAKFEAWFADAEFIEGRPNKIVVEKPFRRNWIIQHFASELARIFGEDVSVEIRA